MAHIHLIEDKLVSIKTFNAHFEYLDGCSDCEGWLDAHWILMEVFEPHPHDGHTVVEHFYSGK